MVVTLLTSCGPDDSLGIASAVNARVESGAKEVDFGREVDSAWDRMFVIGPYAPQAEVENMIGHDSGVDWRRRNQNDAFCLVEIQIVQPFG